MIQQKDSLQFMKEQPDYSADVIYCDPPYNLGSEIIVRSDGKMDYKTKGDFMNKWEAMSGAWWEQWFSESCRALKHGGYLVMFSIDRQNVLFKYYASLAKFRGRASIYWYFISSFPKSTDLSKQIDKNAGAEREVVGENKNHRKLTDTNTMCGEPHSGDGNITAPSTDLAKKYNGYKYSICPLKQVVEEVMIFQKPYKTKSCLHDVLALEAGDKTCAVGALDIDGGRVPLNGNLKQSGGCLGSHNAQYDTYKIKGIGKEDNSIGRYPSQCFIDSEAAELLDLQSGDLTSGDIKPYVSKDEGMFGAMKGKLHFNSFKGDTSGASKILHKCDYSKGEHDLFLYEPKVSGRERNGGLEGFEEKRASGYGYDLGLGNAGEGMFKDRNPIKQNTHPTLKPIALNEKILKLFKTPNEQKILYPFAGVFSEVIGGYKAGFKNFAGCEINPEYIKIGEARFEFWKDRKLDVIEKEVIIAPEQGELF